MQCSLPKGDEILDTIIIWGKGMKLNKREILIGSGAAIVLVIICLSFLLISSPGDPKEIREYFDFFGLNCL